MSLSLLKETPGSLEVDISVARRSFDVRAGFRLEAGERLALFGASGAGKSTLIEALCGLVLPTSGSVRLGGERISMSPAVGRRASRRPMATEGAVSVVRQPTALFPHLDVAANVSYGAADPALAAEMIDCLALGELRRALPAGLSGGQQQRVALARALARPFRLLLLDEPLSAVDRRSRQGLYDVARLRQEDCGAPAILVTHSLADAQAFGEKMALIDEGAIIAFGDPHRLVAEPGSRRAAELLGYGPFLRLAGCEGGEVLELAIDLRRVRLGAAPPGGMELAATVHSCRPEGSGYEVVVRVEAGSRLVAAGGELVTAAPEELAFFSEEPLPLGAQVTATLGHAPVTAGGDAAACRSPSAREEVI